jgi:hypothetical protein
LGKALLPAGALDASDDVGDCRQLLSHFGLENPVPD